MMKAYSKYKDSGIVWVGNIPEHWSIRRLKYLVSITTGGSDTVDNVEEGNYPFFVRSQNVERINSYSYDGEAVLTAGDGVGVAKVFHYADGKFDFHQRVYKFSDFKDILGKFFFYYVRNNLKYEVLKLSAKSTVDSLRMHMLQNFFVALPSVNEQRTIVDFLDCKTAQIDTLIEKKQRQIDLLQEQRTALINHAVTKGLNPDAPMKDSGVEWLGEIPSHWLVSRLKFICSLLKDGTHVPPSRQDTGIPLLSVRNIVNGEFINLPDDSLISLEDHKILTKTFEVIENDVLLAIVGATLGKVALVRKMSPFFIQRSLAVFRPKHEVSLYKFLYYFFRSTNFQSRLWSSVGFSAQPGIYLGALANIHCPLPSLEEQQEIISFLEAEEKAMLETISKIRKQIDLLGEYRTALISEAVTGKIDVR